MKLADLLPYALWLAAGVLSLILSKRSQIDAWAEKNPRTAGFMKLLRGTGLDPWMVVQAVVLIIKGRLPVKLQAAKIIEATGVPVSEDVKVEVVKQRSVAPPKPPGVAMLALMLFAASLALGGATACSSGTPAALGAQSAVVTRAGYNAAAVSLKYLGEMHDEWIKAKEKEGQESAAASLPAARAMMSALDTGAAILAKVRPLVASGKDEAEVRRLLRALLTQQDQLVTLLTGIGKPPPKEVTDALEFLAGFLGGAS